MLQALIVSAEPRIVQVWRQILEEHKIEAHVCGDTVASLSLLGKLKFDSVVVDGADDSLGMMLLEFLRSETMNRNAIVIALVEGKNHKQSTFDLGAHFVLAKGTSPQLASKTVRAALGLMVAERRRYFRYTVDLPVRVNAAAQELEGRITNISQAGAALRLSRQLPPQSNIDLTFSLPPAVLKLTINAQVVWSDANGRAGVRFLSVPVSAQGQIDAWLNERFRC